MEHWLWILLAALFFECKAEDKVMQPSEDVIETEGNSVILDCTFETSSSPTLFWYKKVGNSAPQYMLKVISKTVYNAGDFPKDRFDAELKDKSVPLKIQKLELSDSAVYYCALHQGTQRLIFGSGSRLTVETKEPSQPSFYKVGEKSKACLATGFTSHTAAKDERPELGNATEAVRPEGSSLYSQVFFLDNSDVKCEDSHKGGSDALEPDTVMNTAGLITMVLRLIFIKTVIFNVLITLRMWVSQ